MLGRALSLATVTLLIGCFAAGAAHAQATNLEAGKSPSQIFAGTCTACHKSPRGLLKTVPASSLPGFLRQHYTTSSDMASVLSSFLVSNGATDTRYQAKDQPKQGKDAKQDGKPVQEARPAGPPDQLDRFGRRLHPAAATQEAAKPDADGISPPAEPARPGRNGKRLARPGETPDTAKPADGQTPVQAATDAKMGAKQKLSKRGRPGVGEPPKLDEPAKGEAAKDDSSVKSDTAKDSAKDSAKGEGDKPEAKPAAEGKSETAKVDAPKDSVGGEQPALRPDPVPPVTPAPEASTTMATGTSTPEPAASLSPAVAPPTLPAVTASAPPLPPVAPAGPPAPPISQ
jgi:hypothetical protein